jgi:4-amino-4-deoxy-L-arabinose transferase-like glycosyltransferase
MVSEPQGAPRNPALSAALAMLLAAIVLLTLLGHNRLTDWDEGIYAGISRAMLSGTWLIPHWNTHPWLEKPPLELWLTALSFKLFGVSEFTARLVSAVSGVALIGLVQAWLTLRRTAFTAWLSTCFLLATFGFLHAARVGEMDVLLTLGCTLALIGLAELPNTPRAWYVFFAGFAIALMTKGAASMALPLTLIPFLALQPSLLHRLRSDFFLALVLFLVAVLPWHLYMLHRFGHAFLDNYFGLQVLARATSQIEGHVTPWWYYLRVLLLSAAPFVLLYPFALIDALRKIPLRAFAIFALTTLILFTLVQTRLPHWIVPIYPALSILTAVWLTDRLPAPTLRFITKFAAASLATWVLAALITAAPRKSLHSPRLPTGTTVPDNREQVALLKQAFRDPQIQATPGPLLSWRTGTYNPIPTTVFYANRQVQQVTLDGHPAATLRDKYDSDPIPLTAALVPQPTLMLLDRTLLPHLPLNLAFHPIAVSAELAIGILTANSPQTP